MRAYAQIAPTFWSRGSGRRLRGKPKAQLLALYLMTSPSSNLVGLYYLPLTTICHETGLSESDVREAVALPALAEIARYDFDAEVVWLPECARYQLGEALADKDKRRPAVERELAVFEGHPFANEFRDRYAVGFGLRLVKKTERRPGFQEAPSEAPSQHQEAPFSFPVPDLISDPDSDPERAHEQVDDEPAEPSAPANDHAEGPSLQARATLWLKDATRASFVDPKPWTWREFVEVAAHAQCLFPGFRIEVRNTSHPGLRAFLGRASEGATVADLCLTLDGAALTENIAQKLEHQTFQTIFRDAGQLEKFQRVARSRASSGPVSQVAASPAAEAARRERAAAVEARAKGATR